MAMADEQNGAIALEAGMDVYFPLLYVTADTGDHWREIKLPYDDLPKEVQYLTDIDSFTYENGKFTLILGQGDAGTRKVTFTATDISGIWQYTEMKEATIHTVG
jgi:hypothetical protein